LKNVIIPPEPRDAKEEILRQIDTSSDESFSSLLRKETFYLWWNKRIVSHLWQYWNDDLRLEGYTWPRFENFMRFASNRSIQWLRGSVTWEALVREILETMEALSKRS
jgi:hypothetical protein